MRFPSAFHQGPWILVVAAREAAYGLILSPPFAPVPYPTECAVDERHIRVCVAERL